MKLGIQAALWIASIFFAYKIYDSISGPIRFNKVKNQRYAKVINRMKDIRTAQIAHKDVRGVYANNFDKTSQVILTLGIAWVLYLWFIKKPERPY